MLGAIIGDIVGSVYEFNNIKTTDFPLFSDDSQFTDDTVMTLAVAEALMEGGKPQNYVAAMKKYGALYPNEKFYPNAGYGGKFGRWLASDDTTPYNSYGNGSAMRVSPVAWWYDTLGEVEKGAKTSAAVTHNHPEGIKGAQAVAAAIFLARTGESKDAIRDYIESKYGYNLRRTLEEIRPNYKFNETCQGSVPEAIIAFLESYGFEDAIRKAVSIGGDSDTIAAITGSIAEAAYGVPDEIKRRTLHRLDSYLLLILNLFCEKIQLLGSEDRRVDWHRRELLQYVAALGEKEAAYELAEFNEQEDKEILDFALYIIFDKKSDNSENEIALARELMEKLASKGNRGALQVLGNIYYTGRAGHKQDFVKARKWYEKAAELGDHWALCYLGYIYYYGRGVKVDYEKAFLLFARSAYKGNYNGMYKIGDHYYYGNFVEQDYDSAFYWYKRAENAAEQAIGANYDTPELPNVLYRLGLCFAKGHGVTKNLVNSLSYLVRAEPMFYDKIIFEDDLFAKDTLQKTQNLLKTVRKQLNALAKDKDCFRPEQQNTFDESNLANGRNRRQKYER